MNLFSFHSLVANFNSSSKMLIAVFVIIAVFVTITIQLPKLCEPY